jgi:uncharacterized protein YbjT (DUF2867 family)
MENSSNSGKTVLVTGAVGQQGGMVVTRMLEKGWKLRALTRKPDSPAVKALAGQGVEIAKGDLENPASLDAACRGVYGVFSVQDGAVGAEREILQGKNMADAAKKAGVEHLVYNSVGGANRNTGISIWERKWEIENHIRKIGVPYTVLRPVSFLEDYFFQMFEIQIIKGTLYSPVRGDKEYQMIATRDIGGFVQLAFERPGEFIGMELEIAGSALTPNESAKVFSKVLNRPVKYRHIPLFVNEMMMGKDVNKMFRWLNSSGYKADVPGLRKRYPELKLSSLEDWLIDEKWHRHARPVKIVKGSWTFTS